MGKDDGPCKGNEPKPRAKLGEKKQSKIADLANLAKDKINIPKIDFDIKKSLGEFDLKNIKHQLKNLSSTKISDGINFAKNWIIQMGNPGKMDKAAGPTRPMKYPYTFSAKFAQFPMGHYVKNQWIWKYYALSLGICVPVFYYIHKLSNSPGNVAKWAEIRRKEAQEHHH